MGNEFQKNTINGISWSAVSQLIKLILNLGLTAVMARLLLPEDYGILGMITVATGFLLVIKDFGFGAALVQKEKVDSIEYNSVFWLNVVIGILLALIVYLCAPLIAWFYNEDKLIPVAEILSIGFIINSFIVVPNNILLKNIKFKKLFYIETLSIVIGGGLGIILAVNGWAYWSLVGQTLTTQLTSLILVYLLAKWKPTFNFSKKGLSGLTKFSLPLLADSSINYWVRNIDYLLIGKYLGTAQLGYYSKAYTLMLLPVRQLSGTITRVMFPSFSLIQNNLKRVSSIYLRISAVIAMISFPLMCVLFTVSEDLIIFMFGLNWVASIPIFKVLCILGAFQSIATLSGNIYLSQGKTSLMLQVGLFTRSLMILGIVIGLFKGGLMGLVYGYTISSSLATLIELYFVSTILTVNLKKIILNLFPYAIFSLTMLVCIQLIQKAIVFNSHFFNLLFIGLSGGVIYLILLILFKPIAFKELKNLINLK